MRYSEGFSGYGDARNFKEDQLAFSEVERQIRELEGLIKAKRMSLRFANPDSMGELTADSEEILRLEGKLKDLNRKKKTMEGGAMGAD